MIRRTLSGITVRTSSLWALGTALTLALTSCTGFAATGERSPTTSPLLAAEFAILPEPTFGSEGVSPVQPVRMTVTGGKLLSLTLTNPAGRAVKGRFTSGRAGWESTEALGFAKTYTWSGKAVSSDGERYPISGTFTTVAPKTLVAATANVSDGGVYGIAMPIVLTFSEPVRDTAAVERALTVRTTPATEGSWAWEEGGGAVHWRPRRYWQPGTEVSLDAAVYGVRTAEGSYGGQDLAAEFRIGRGQVVHADARTRRVSVVRDGKPVAEYPASFGDETDPTRVTPSGIHVILAKYPGYADRDARPGCGTSPLRWAVRLSGAGVFLHSAPGSVAEHGLRNVTSGCVHLAPAAAEQYFAEALVGDPVEVVGTARKLGPDDVYLQWTRSWDQWQARSALAE